MPIISEIQIYRLSIISHRYIAHPYAYPVPTAICEIPEASAMSNMRKKWSTPLRSVTNNGLLKCSRSSNTGCGYNTPANQNHNIYTSLAPRPDSRALNLTIVLVVLIVHMIKVMLSQGNQSSNHPTLLNMNSINPSYCLIVR